MNDLQYNILGLEGVIGIKELKLFQTGEGRNMFNYQADGDTVDDGESGYGFQYSFGDVDGVGALEHGIIRPSVTPAVFELRNPNTDIYGKVV
jgi:hypothetical protein